MENFEPIREVWADFILKNNLNEWVNSIRFLMKIFKDNQDFKSKILIEALSCFENQLTQEQKSDLFLSFLRDISESSEEKGGKV